MDNDTFDIANFSLTSDCQFGPPSDITFYDNRFYLVDEFNHRVLVFDNNGGQCSVIGKKGNGPGDFFYPKGISVDSKGYLLITDCWNHRIQQFSPDGRVVSCFGQHGKGVGELNEPFGIVLDRNNWIFVVERGNHRVHVFDDKGVAQGFFGTRGSVVEEERAELYGTNENIFFAHPFEFPTSIALGSNGDLFVVDSGNHRIQRFTTSGSFLKSFGTSGDGKGEFQHPYGIAVDHNDNIFISDFNNHRIQRLTYSGEYISSCNTLNFPTAVCIKDTTTLIAGSGFNHEIKKVSYPEKKAGDVYRQNIHINDKDKRSCHKLGKIYIETGNPEGEELLKKAFSIAAGDISIEDNSDDDITIDLLNSLFTDIPSGQDMGLADSIIKYFDNKTCKIENKVSAIKDELIEVTEKCVEKRLMIEKDTLQGNRSDTQHEKEEFNLMNKEKALKVMINKYSLIYKNTALKRCEVLNILSDHCIEAVNPDYAWEIIVKDSLQQFFNTCAILSNLFEEKNRYEKEAEGYFKNSTGNDEENWKGFQKNFQKAEIMSMFLERMLMVSKIFINSTAGLASVFEKKENIFSFFQSELKKNDSLIKDISKILLFFNSDWTAIYHNIERIKIELNIIEGLDSVFSNTLFKSGFHLLHSQRDTFDMPEELILNIEKDDYIADKLFIIHTASLDNIHNDIIEEVLQKEKENTCKHLILRILQKIEGIEKKIQEKEQQRGLITAELVKAEILMDAALSDNNKYIILARKISLLSFNHTLIKKEISRLFHIYKLLVFHLANLLMCILKMNTDRNDADRIEGIKDEFNHLMSDIDRTMKIQKQKEYEVHKAQVFTKNDAQKNSNIADAENERRSASYSMDYVTVSLKRYEEIRDITAKIAGNFNIQNIPPMDLNIVYDKTFIKFSGNEREILFPSGITVDNDGMIFIVEEANHRVKKVTAEGKFIANFGSYGNLPGMLDCPVGIAVDKNNIIYICDTGNHRIQRFSYDGKFIGSFGRQGSGQGEFKRPLRIFIDHDQNIYITDYGNNRVQKLNSNGEFIMSFGEKGDSPGQLNGPTGIFVTCDGNILINEFYNRRLQLFDSKGASIKTAYLKKYGVNEFYYTPDITRDKTGNIYIADYHHSCIQIFSSTLEFKRLLGRYSEGYQPLDAISAVVTHDDYLFTAGYYNGIHRYKL